MVQSALTPPSTSMSPSSPPSTIQPRMVRILSSMVGMYAWPPKPGFTVITSTWSTSHRTFLTISAGVWGFGATEGEPPRSRILPSMRWRWSQASTWTMTTPGSPVGALRGLNVVLNHGLRGVLGDHQLRLEGRAAVLAAGPDHLRAEGEVGHEVTVHHVELDAVHAGGLQVFAGLAHVRPVRGQHRGDDLDLPVGAAGGRRAPPAGPRRARRRAPG